MNLTGAFSRYHILVSLLNGRSAMCTPDALSSLLKVPVEQVRKDLAELIASVYTLNAMYIETSGCRALLRQLKNDPDCAEMDPEYCALTEYFNESDLKEIRRLLLQGDLDHTAFSLDMLHLVRNAEPASLISLDQSEIMALSRSIPEFASVFLETDYRTKSAVTDIPSPIRSYIRQIAEARQLGYHLRIRWHEKTGKFREDTVNPAGIFQSIEDGKVYCLSAGGLSIPLHAVKELKPSLDPITETVSRPFTEKDIHYLWGVPSYHETEPTPVVLRINPEAANILNKIRNETLSRKKHASLQKREDGYYIYRDQVLGIDGFRRWLRGYGSSVIVLEPEWLAQEMLQSARNWIRCYEERVF